MARLLDSSRRQRRPPAGGGDPLPPARRDSATESIAVLERRLFHREFIVHQHAAVELTLIVRGSGRRHVAGTVEPYSDGDLVLIGAYTPHLWQSDAPEGAVSGIVIQFAQELVTAMPAPELRGIRDLLARARRGLVIEGASRDEVARDVLAIHDAPAGSWRRPVTLIAALGRLAAGDSRRHVRALGGPEWAAAPTAPTAEPPPELERMLAEVELGVARGLAQGAVAARLGLSPAAFSRFFKRHVGETFQTYAEHARLARACRALIESDRPITEIAYDAGWSSLTNFNRRFRALRGLTPREYRRLHRSTR